MDQNVLYHGQLLTLTRFWETGEPCLWITTPEQIGMPKMEFVGGHPDEYCIFLKNLTETELAQITSLDCALLEGELATNVLAALREQDLPELAVEIAPDWEQPNEAVQSGLETLRSHLELVQGDTVLLYEMT